MRTERVHSQFMKHKRKITNYRYIARSAVALLCISAVAVLLCVSYVRKLSDILREEAYASLAEISSHISDSLSYKIEGDLKNLSATAACYARYPSENSTEAAVFLQQEQERYGYSLLYFAGKDGVLHLPNGTLKNLSGQDFFQTALKGRPAVSSLTASPADGAQALSFAVPVYRENRTIGVLGGVSGMENARDSLSMEAFNGQGFCHIVTRGGDAVLNSANTNAVQNVDNCFSLWQSSALEHGVSIEGLRTDFANGKSGTFHFNPDGTTKYVHYRPLSFNDWYLLTVVPNNTIAAKTQLFVTGTAILCSIVALGFVALLCLVVAQQKRNQRTWKDMAYIDPVTKGPSSRLFERKASALISGAPPLTYAMAALNPDHFKLINESYGREEGNRVLRHIYNKAAELLDGQELAVRAFSDHFFLLLKTTDPDEIRRRLTQARESVNRFNRGLEQKYYLTFSQGVYLIEDPKMDLITIEDRASAACNSAQRDSAGDPVFYHDGTRQKMLKEKRMANRTPTALAQGEFLVYLQPKYRLENNRVEGAEALVRWNDPEVGMIFPNDFIPLFEKNGSIIKLDYYVFEEVVKTLRSWIRSGKRPLPISVNLSRAHLSHPDFLERYRALCESYEVPPQLIEIEVTETLALENLSRLVKIIRALHEIGFRCSIDDFGNGYSSLNLLADLPVDILKLDRSFFLSNVEQDSPHGIVVEHILSLARSLSMETVAEGIESSQQVSFLRKAQCGFIQGYIFSKPIPIPAFERLAFPDFPEHASKKTSLEGVTS